MSISRVVPMALPRSLGLWRLGLVSSVPHLSVGRSFCAMQDPNIKKFVDSAFTYFDDNNNGVIEYFEIERAYLHKSAGSEVFRLFVSAKLAGHCTYCGSTSPASTAKVLEKMDLIKAVQERKIKLRKANIPDEGQGGQYDLKEGIITKPVFESWCLEVVDFYKKEMQSARHALPANRPDTPPKAHRSHIEFAQQQAQL